MTLREHVELARRPALHHANVHTRRRLLLSLRLLGLSLLLSLFLLLFLLLLLGQTFALFGLLDGGGLQR